MSLLARFIKSEEGATAIEYALIATMISVAIIGGATALGPSLDTGLNKATDEFNNL